MEKDRQDKSAASWKRDEEEEEGEEKKRGDGGVAKVGRAVGKLNLDMWNKAPSKPPPEKVPKPKMNIKKDLPQVPKVFGTLHVRVCVCVYV